MRNWNEITNEMLANPELYAQAEYDVWVETRSDGSEFDTTNYYVGCLFEFVDWEDEPTTGRNLAHYTMRAVNPVWAERALDEDGSVLRWARIGHNIEQSFTSIVDALAGMGWVGAEVGDPGDHYVVHVREAEEARWIDAASEDEVGESYTVDGYLLRVTKEGMPPHFTRFFGTLKELEDYLAAGEVMGQTAFAWREEGE